ncbi:MAG: hypothetical protein AB8G05_15445 [Oligoflexales bacterium]
MRLSMIFPIFALLVTLLSTQTQATEKKQLRKSIQSSVQVNGIFKVSAIETKKFPRGDSEYKRIYFQELETSKKDLQEIYLDSVSVHPALKPGSSFELSAEVNSKVQSKKAFEALQILLFIPQNGRKISVWLLSLKNKDLDLRGAKYFKMHNPDFIIL